jgi:hypothetical protein
MAGSDDVELSEDLVKDALERISWADLERHLVAISFDADDLKELLDHLKRHSKFIAKYPAATFERKRDAFLDALESFVLGAVGSDGPPRVQEYRGVGSSTSATSSRTNGIPSPASRRSFIGRRWLRSGPESVLRRRIFSPYSGLPCRSRSPRRTRP